LGSYESKPFLDLRFHWLVCDDWRTRVALCASCQADNKTLEYLKKNVLKKWKLNVCESLCWGEEISIDEIAKLISQKCRVCGDVIEKRFHVEGFKVFHKECVGIFDNLRG